MPIYTYTQLRQRINGGIKGKIGVLIDERGTINEAVRQVISDFDLKSTIREIDLDPNLDSDVETYNEMTDLKGYGIIDVVPVDLTARQKPEYQLTLHEDFNRSFSTSGIITVEDRNFTRTLKIKTQGITDEENKIVYYTKYGWQNSGTYKENSTVGEDLLNADTSEYNLFVQKGIEIAGEEVDEIQAADRARQKYQEQLQKYKMDNPSQAKSIITTYARFI